MMTLITNGGEPSSTGHARPKHLTGTAHHGPNWTNAVHVLRAAIQNGVGHAGQRRSVTSERVGGEIIDRIGELDPKALHVLAMTFAMLVRTSRRDQR